MIVIIIIYFIQKNKYNSIYFELSEQSQSSRVELEFKI